MDVTLVGTGTPIPISNRNGMCIHIENDDDQLLLDCGPGSVPGLLEAGIDPTEIEKIIFTHHHMDHNVDFYHFAIGTWVVGRSKLEIYGPTGTQDLHSGLESSFSEDLKARETVGDRSMSGLTDISARTISGGETIELEQWKITTLTVDHANGLETLAYRVEEKDTGDTVVYSSDTAKVPGMVEFAQGVDILLHDSTLAPYAGETPSDQVIWTQFTEIDEDFYDHLSQIHSTPRQAGEIGADASVGTLVLTHILPYRDTQAMVDMASKKFNGEVLVAEDGMTLST